uniref:Uncharacterized protein n=1 Tax=Globodera rostochiensis TaxID=31243 RepID=A0A914I1C5_GLORO
MKLRTILILLIIGQCLLSASFVEALLRCKNRRNFNEKEPNERYHCGDADQYCFSAVCKTYDAEEPEYYVFGCDTESRDNKNCFAAIKNLPNIEKFSPQKWNCSCWYREKGQSYSNEEAIPAWALNPTTPYPDLPIDPTTPYPDLPIEPSCALKSAHNSFLTNIQQAQRERAAFCGLPFPVASSSFCLVFT